MHVSSRLGEKCVRHEAMMGGLDSFQRVCLLNSLSNLVTE